jgi:hypothetical protein
MVSILSAIAVFSSPPHHGLTVYNTSEPAPVLGPPPTRSNRRQAIDVKPILDLEARRRQRRRGTVDKPFQTSKPFETLNLIGSISP